MSRLLDRLPPPAIVERQKQSKFICSSCGGARDCDCNAPALERLAKLEERVATQREAKRQQKQRERERANENNDHVAATDDAEADQPQPEAAPEPAPEQHAPPPAHDPIAALEEATKLKHRIVHDLMPLMTASGRDQFLVVLVEDVRKAAETPVMTDK